MYTRRTLLQFFSLNSLPIFYFLLFFAGHVAFAAKHEADGGRNLPSTTPSPTSPFKAHGECGSSHEIVGALCNPGVESRAKASCLKYQQEGTLTWQPQPGRFLFMCCTFGRESNRLYCLRMSLYMAAILNRTLLFHQAPAFNHHKIDRHIFFDHLHTRKCYGRESVMTVAEYREKYNTSVVIDQIRLLTEVPQSLAAKVYVPDSESENKSAEGKGSAEMLSRGGNLMLSHALESETGDKLLDVKIKEGLKVEYVHGLGKNRSYISKDEFLAEYAGLSSKVLFIWEGYTSTTRIKQYEFPNLLPGHLPVKRLPGCPNHLVVQPHPAILGAVDTYLATSPALRRGYIGVHMRRDDFVTIFTKVDHSVTRRAESVKQVVVATGLHTIFLCTDGSPAEIEEFSAAFRSEKEGSPAHAEVIMLGLKSSAWTKYLEGQHIKMSPSVVMNVEKVVVALSTVFLNEKRSTFSKDIARLRLGFNKTNCFDQLLCGDCG